MDLVTLALAKKYTKASLEGAGALKGDTGSSAYEVAVANGFSGTQTEWLNSLNGSDGKSAYEIACENGYEGDQDEWLQSLQGQLSVTQDVAEELWSGYATSGSEITLNASIYKYSMLHIIVGTVNCIAVIPPRGTNTIYVYGSKTANGVITHAAATLTIIDNTHLNILNGYYIEQCANINGSSYAAGVSSIRGIANAALLAQ